MIADTTTDYKSYISLGDPTFTSYYILDKQVFFFEAKGEGIFQGVIWVQNASTVDLLFDATEILV